MGTTRSHSTRSLALAALAAALAAAACAGPDFGVHDVPLIGDDGLLYTVPVTVAGQTLQAQLDTGSTTVALASAACTNCSGVSPLFEPDSRPIEGGSSVTSLYAGGQDGWNGQVYGGAVAVGSAPAQTVDFVAITSSIDFFYGNAYQGIFGMGPDSLLVPGTSSYTDPASAAGMGEFAYRMCGDHGDLWLGGYDSTAAASAPQFTEMASAGEDSSGYTINGGELALGGSALANGDVLGDVLVDSGGPLTYVPADVAAALVVAVGSAPGYAGLFGTQQISDASCVTTTATAAEIDAALPPITLQVSGVGDLQQLSWTATQGYLYDAGGGQWCLSVVDGTQYSDDVAIGDTMMASLLTVFDLDHDRIGFAPVAGCGTEATAAVRDHSVTATTLPGIPWSPYSRPRARAPRH